jgi:tetratricopeptide (TPR) repeat protein
LSAAFNVFKGKESPVKKRWVGIFAALLWLVSLAVPAAHGSQNLPADDLVAQAKAHFERGFYEDAPKGRGPEAAAEFAQAARLFEQALAADPNDAVAHRHLARVYAVQAKHLLAAKHYQRAAEIDTLDLDALVLAASEYADAKHFTESRTLLQMAQGRTTDPHALKWLQGFLKKLDDAEESGKKSK